MSLFEIIWDAVSSKLQDTEFWSPTIVGIVIVGGTIKVMYNGRLKRNDC